MRFRDLIDLFLDDDNVLRPHDEVVARDRQDNTSLAHIVRVLRELDGQHEARRHETEHDA